MIENKKYTLIAGPTASGKSALALKISAKNDGVIVNADALQVYDCYQILTARPSADDLSLAPHALYGHVPNIAGYSVGEWLREITALIKKEERPLIIVGGTGLYFDAILNGLSEIPPTPPALKEKLEWRLQSEGLESLVKELQNIDPEIAARLDLQNPRRVLRALEVYHATGAPLSHWQSRTPAPLIDMSQTDAFVVMPDTDTTNKRIKRRFDQMLEHGAIEEVKAQMNPWNEDLPANKALGAREIAAYLQGQITLDEARAKSNIATRQYAKRQRSWFRSRMKAWRWLDAANINE